jgi:Ca-activated chloride channel homolog
MTFGFQYPWALLLLATVPFWYLWRRAGRRSIRFSRAATMASTAGWPARWLAVVPDWARAGTLALLIVALAGPRTGASTTTVDAEGIALVLVVDISSSMLAEDFHPHNRLAVARQQVASFIRGRQHDRIGMVAFAGQAVTLVPLTIDYPVLYRAIDQLQIGLVEDGTAIGTAIATATNRLRRVPGESRVIILLTDGENNRGEIDPITAALAAAAYDIRIHTIAVGTDGVAPIPIARGILGGYQYANLPVSIDEELLQEIADLTGGSYFRATDEAALDQVYREIDQLETTTVEVSTYTRYTPHHRPLLLFAALLLIGEWGLLGSRWGRVP